jgi:hypothetical protein
MLSEQLVQELRKLNRAAKLRAVQLLVNDLAAAEETLLQAGMTYETATPYGNEAAAVEIMSVFRRIKKL